MRAQDYEDRRRTREMDRGYEALVAVCRRRAENCVAIVRVSNSLPQMTTLTAVAARLESLARKFHSPGSVTVSDLSRAEDLLRIYT